MNESTVRRISGGKWVYLTVLRVLEPPMRTQLIPAKWLKFRKERGSVACWGQKQRNRKPSILRDANARRVWARLNCLKPSPHGLIVDASERKRPSAT
jgi:hypothetical protein